MRKVVVVGILLLLASRVNALDEAPVSLHDVIRLSSLSSTTDDAATALSRASEMTARARRSPRASVATTTGLEPDTGGIRFRTTGQAVLDFGSALGRLGELAAAQAQLATSSATLAASRRSTAAAAISAYFAIVSDQAQVRAQSLAVDGAKRSLTAATQRLQAGNAPEIDVERTRSILATSLAELNSATSALSDDRISLGALIGRTEAVTVRTPELPTAIPDASSVETAALKTNPNVATARAAYAASQAALLVARAQLEPGFSLGAGIGFTRLAGQQQVGPAVSMSINLPFATGLAKANVASAQAAILVAKTTLELSQRDAVQSALRTRTTANASLARLGQLRYAYEAARRVADAELKAYRIGAVGGADLLVAQTQANAANSALQNAIVQLAEAQASLQFETGGFTS